MIRHAMTRLTIRDLVERYKTEYVATYYRKPCGRKSHEQYTIKQALRVLCEVAGDESVENFGTRRLKDVREAMVEKGWAVNHINKQVSRIRSCFSWGVEEEIISPEQHYGLKRVKGLKAYRCDAKVTEPVGPVYPYQIEAIRPYVASPVYAVMQLQRFTGARGGELLEIRPVDLDMSNRIWEYRPRWHKTAHRGKRRVIWFDSRAQEVVRPFLARDVSRPLFSPREAWSERLDKPAPEWVGDHYSPNTYRQAIVRACDSAGIDSWHPHQLRHLAKMEFARKYGSEIARILLGHSSIDVTEFYGEIDAERIRDALAAVG